MPMNETTLFSLEKVKALKAYFKQCSAGMKGRAEWHDYDTAAKLCDQLLAHMSQQETPAKPGRKKAEVAANA